ncbi:major facilitator superfamily permease [Leifsonia xyli subsp. cynodontis DSM 46306]|uniref:Uncharacterized protein n=1 Tax=Leifsonia xyli subsp. cynodontis DSM 46306 TaxID=1389489 RepID=U3P8I0_LEIXC|nr:major facilitator superfamily permease [Leifsonia xyli subsp. cynodontis DSM 46306]
MVDAVEMRRCSASAPAVTATSVFIDAMMYRSAFISFSLSRSALRDSRLSRCSASCHWRIASSSRRIWESSSSARPSSRADSCRGFRTRGSIIEPGRRLASSFEGMRTS